jgi:hypothetical protein
MQFRKFWTILAVVMLVMTALTGCAAGSQSAWPDREVTIDLDTALAAQEIGMGGLATGSVEWTESEFSSFLTFLLRQNVGENFPIDNITTYFEPDNRIFIRVNLMDGVMLGGDTIDLVGSVGVEDMHLMVDIEEAGANGVSIAGDFLQPISDQINGALAGQMGVAVDVATEEGMIMVGMAQ